MIELVDELSVVADTLRALSRRGSEEGFAEPLGRLEAAANEVSRSWSGSSLGYQSYVYYKDFQAPPPGMHFSQEWGFLGRFHGTLGEWFECDYDAVIERIYELAGRPDISSAQDLALEARTAAAEGKATIDSVVESWLADHDDGFIARLRDEVEAVTYVTAVDATNDQVRTGQLLTRDTTALGQGFRHAPHQAVIGDVLACRSPLLACDRLATLADRSAAHMARVGRRAPRAMFRGQGTMVFIGHGQSQTWRELKDFIQGRLGLAWDEFNRVPVAGVPNVERLVQMLDDARVAFLVLTAEDERIDGQLLARQNVVHEAGLFQGRLGFSRAILLLEEGCGEFSNIAGLGQIRFPAKNIAAGFEEVRRVLEREGILRSPNV